MFSWLSKHLPFANLGLIVCVGAALGLLSAVTTGIFLSPPRTPDMPATKTTPSHQQPLSLNDYSVIIERNIFNHQAKTTVPPFDRNGATQPTTEANGMILLGTVVAETDSLALIRQNDTSKIYHLGEQLPGGAHIEAIERHRIVIRSGDGTQRELIFQNPQPASPAAQPLHASEGIREIGRNQWLVSHDEMEKARSNLNALLKSVRMEPKIKNGHTEGFVVKMIRPKSLLERLGVKRNDVVREVNGVSLDSPEKALQIFQQLREAQRIVVGLERRNKPMNLEYTIE